MNQTSVTICGRLVADPEMRQTTKGNVATMRVVVNEWRRKDDGSWGDGPSNFYSVSAWGPLGEHAITSLKKGFRVIVAGTLRVNSYQSDGRTMERLEVQADHLGADLKFGVALYRPRQRGAANGPREHVAERSDARADEDRADEQEQESQTPAYEVLEPGADPAPQLAMTS